MNKSISNLHLETLDKKRQELLKKLLPFSRGFVLGGGTGLALQINHRKSFDFDFFSQSEISDKLLEKISREIAIDNIAVDTKDELTFFTKDGIKVTFLYYPFKPLFEPIEGNDGILLFPIKEIALQKAYTVGRRGEYRDYFDLYTILKDTYSTLDETLKAARQVYNSVFDEKIFLQQLVYFDDLRSFEITPPSNRTVPSKDDIKQYFEQLVKNYVAR